MALAFDNASVASGNTNNLVYSHTCSGNQRVLFVTAKLQVNSGTVTGITYNGVAMTYIARAQYTSSAQWVYLYYLIAPATGTNNVSVSFSASGPASSIASSYTGASQTAQPDAFLIKEQGNATSITVSPVATSALGWALAVLEGNNNANASLTLSGALTAKRTAGVDDGVFLADSNGTVGSTGAIAMGFNQTTTTLNAMIGVIIAVEPLASVTTDPATNIQTTSAGVSGNVTADGGSTITERGFVYSTSTNPTISSNKAVVAGTLGTMSTTLTGLLPNTTYYVRGFATNSFATGYGNEISFTTVSAPARTVYKDISGVAGVTYGVRLTIGGTVGTLTVQLGSTGSSQIYPAGSGTVTFSGTYGGLNGLTFTASTDFNGWVDDVFYVIVPTGASVNDVNWTLDLFTTSIAINSSVLFRRVEDTEFNRFRIYRYLDLLFKDLDGYVTATVREEANDGVTVKDKEFLVGGTTGDVSPFVKKRISFLGKVQALLVGVSNNRKDDAFTISAYQLSGQEQPKKLFKGGNIIGMS